jgi:hypothetical protein
MDSPSLQVSTSSVVTGLYLGDTEFCMILGPTLAGTNHWLLYSDLALTLSLTQ